MKQTTLKESFESCRGQGSVIMKGITEALDSTGISYRSNKRKTQVVVDKSKEELSVLLEKKGPKHPSMDMMLFTKEEKGKTYLRLLFQ